jgi:hypothetical protein
MLRLYAKRGHAAIAAPALPWKKYLFYAIEITGWKMVRRGGMP